MHRRRFTAAFAAAAATALAGCTGTGGSGEPTTDSNAGMGGDDEATIAAVNTTFDPVRASVTPGTTVVWENQDAFEHTVVSAQFHDAAASWSFDANLTGGGGTAEYTFESAGVYEYYCDVHGKSTMCGVVLVGDAALDAALPCESDGGGGGDDGMY